MTIDEKIEALPKADKIRFNQDVEDTKFVRVFGQRHGSEYTETEMTGLKEERYQKLFGSS